MMHDRRLFLSVSLLGDMLKGRSNCSNKVGVSRLADIAVDMVLQMETRLSKPPRKCLCKACIHRGD